MASNKSKTTSAAEVNGKPSVADAVSAAAGAEIPTGGKLRGRFKAADSVAHRTKKPRKTPKAAAAKTSADKVKPAS